MPEKEKSGGVAQMVERSLSMREVPGSIPGASTEYFIFFHRNSLMLLLTFPDHLAQAPLNFQLCKGNYKGKTIFLK